MSSSEKMAARFAPHEGHSRMQGAARPLRLSRDGGSAALWSPEGDRIWYRSDQGVYEVRLEPEFNGEMDVSEPELLFPTHSPRWGSVWTRDFDYSPRRGQFLLLGPEPGLAQTSVHIRVDWFAALEHLRE